MTKLFLKILQKITNILHYLSINLTLPAFSPSTGTVYSSPNIVLKVVGLFLVVLLGLKIKVIFQSINTLGGIVSRTTHII